MRAKTVLFLLVFLAIGALSWSSAQAGGVRIGIGIPIGIGVGPAYPPPPYYYGYPYGYYPRPVYVYPQPVYVQPQPTYVQGPFTSNRRRPRSSPTIRRRRPRIRPRPRHLRYRHHRFRRPLQPLPSLREPDYKIRIPGKILRPVSLFMARRAFSFGKFRPITARDVHAQMTLQLPREVAARQIPFQFVPLPAGTTEQDYVAAAFDIRPLQDKDASITFDFSGLSNRTNPVATFTPHYAKFSFRPYIAQASSPRHRSISGHRGLGRRGPKSRRCIQFMGWSWWPSITHVSQSPRRHSVGKLAQYARLGASGDLLDYPGL